MPGLGLEERVLCRLADLQDGASRGFDPDENGEDRLFAIRRGATAFVYVNSCPHNRRPLEFRKDRFLSRDGSEILCYAHGAHFTVESGTCTYGPCLGKALISVAARVEDGWVIISLEA
jgi:nitrite reductase/ring-hydroxylating ferredoxin subunit